MGDIIRQPVFRITFSYMSMCCGDEWHCDSVIIVCEADLYSLKLYVSQLVSQWTSARAKAFELKRFS